MPKMHPYHQLPGEGGDMCCWCVPIKPGVIVIGIIVLLTDIMSIKNTIDAAGVNSLQGALWIVTMVPLVLSLVIFIQFFLNNRKTERLSLACMLVVLACLLQFAIILIFFFTSSTKLDRFLGALIPTAVDVLLFTYFAGVCKRYHG